MELHASQQTRFAKAWVVAPVLPYSPCNPYAAGAYSRSARASAVPEMSSGVNAGMAPKASVNAGQSCFPKTFERQVMSSLHTAAHHSPPVAVSFPSPDDSGSYDTILVLSCPVLGLMRIEASDPSTWHPDRRPSTPSDGGRRVGECTLQGLGRLGAMTCLRCEDETLAERTGSHTRGKLSSPMSADNPVARSQQSQGPEAPTQMTTVCRLGSLRRLNPCSSAVKRCSLPRRSSSKVLCRPVMWSSGIQASAPRRRRTKATRTRPSQAASRPGRPADVM